MQLLVLIYLCLYIEFVPTACLLTWFTVILFIFGNIYVACFGTVSFP